LGLEADSPNGVNFVVEVLTIVVIVVVLLVGGGAGVFLARDAGWRSRSGLPLRPRRAVVLPTIVGGVVRSPGNGTDTPQPRAIAATPMAGLNADLVSGNADQSPDTISISATARPPQLDRLGEAWRDEFGAAWDEARGSLAQQDERLARLERRLTEDNERLSQTLAMSDREARSRQEAMELFWSATDARQESAWQQLRTTLLATLAERDEQRDQTRDDAAWGWHRQRRGEVAADLYARLARLEAAIAAVTNPILLPGERYAPPTDLPPDSLSWENWKDVGERAFAFADAFSSQCLFLDEHDRVEVAAFVSSLRRLLTQAIYPNLRPDPTAAQTNALMEALTSLSDALPRVRLLLEGTTRLPGRPSAS